jgi:hypothetical protein
LEANLPSELRARVTASPLLWGESLPAEVLGERYDLILAADVVFKETLVGPLLHSLYALAVGPGRGSPVLLCCEEHNPSAMALLRNLAPQYFCLDLLPPAALHPKYQDSHIALYRLRPLSGLDPTALISAVPAEPQNTL